MNKYWWKNEILILKKTKPYWSYGWLYDVYVCFCEQTYLSYEIFTNNNTLYNVIKFIYPKFSTTKKNDKPVLFWLFVVSRFKLN